MKNIFFILLATLLAACVAQPAAPTATVTPPPTITLIPSAIPTASVTPTPTEAPLPEGIGELQKKLNETDYSVGWSEENKEQLALFYTDKDGKKAELPEVTVNPDGSWKRAYNLPYIEEKFVVEGTMADMEIIPDEDGTKNLGFYNWKVEDGKFTIETAININPETMIETTTNEKVYSNEEAIQIILTENENFGGELDNTESNERALELRNKYYDNANPELFNINGILWKPDIRSINPDKPLLHNSWIDVREKDGTRSIISTFFYAFIDMGEYGFLMYKDANGNDKYIFIDDNKITDADATSASAYAETTHLLLTR